MVGRLDRLWAVIREGCVHRADCRRHDSCNVASPRDMSADPAEFDGRDPRDGLPSRRLMTVDLLRDAAEAKQLIDCCSRPCWLTRNYRRSVFCARDKARTRER
jgi:hypothetical protein